MSATKKSSDTHAVNKVFFVLASIVAVVLITIGGLAWWAHSFATNMVNSELSAQKIYFPEKGAANFSPEVYPDIQKYAGQLVDSGEKAKAYANGYIGRHLKNIADGKVYAEVSAAAAKDPDNEELQAQKQQLFQGETLRGILLGTGYAFGTVGMLAGIAAMILFGLGGVAILLAIWFAAKQSRR